MNEYYGNMPYSESLHNLLMHSGVPGMHWGIRKEKYAIAARRNNPTPSYRKAVDKLLNNTSSLRSQISSSGPRISKRPLGRPIINTIEANAGRKATAIEKKWYGNRRAPISDEEYEEYEEEQDEKGRIKKRMKLKPEKLKNNAEKMRERINNRR